MHPYRDSRITRTIIGIFFLLVFVYAYYEARGLLYGPQIMVSSGILEVHTPYVIISGTTTHIASLTANGQEIPVTKDGAFADPYLLTPGDNRIILEAKDKYGRTTQRIVEAVLTDTSSSTATSTATTIATTTATSTPVAPKR